MHAAALLTATLVAAVSAFLALYPRSAIPTHLRNHPVSVIKGLIPPETGHNLRSAIKTLGEDEEGFPDVAKGVGKTPWNEHIGEATPLSPDGTCSHPFLVPNANRTQCVLPGRIDVGRHFILTGGSEGLKESYEDMVSRVSAFMRYIFKPETLPEVKALFSDQRFISAARQVCPKEKQVLDAFQYNFLLQAPGQTVATHLDAPYFWGASRYTLPQWLLVVMVFSGLFSDRFVDQVNFFFFISSSSYYVVLTY